MALNDAYNENPSFSSCSYNICIIVSNTSNRRLPFFMEMRDRRCGECLSTCDHRNVFETLRQGWLGSEISNSNWRLTCSKLYFCYEDKHSQRPRKKGASERTYYMTASWMISMARVSIIWSAAHIKSACFKAGWSSEKTRMLIVAQSENSLRAKSKGNLSSVVICKRNRTWGEGELTSASRWQPRSQASDLAHERPKSRWRVWYRVTSSTDQNQGKRRGIRCMRRSLRWYMD